MHMEFVQNVPFFTIMLCMVGGIVSSMLSEKGARRLTLFVALGSAAMNLWLTFFLAGYGKSYVYWMGHFPAPIGNEIRAGILESTMAVGFALIMFFSVLGGTRKMSEQLSRTKVSLVYTMLNLVLAAMMSMIFTNDLFTGYVFIEIMTLTSCALIMSRQNGRTLVSAMRYMIMSLLGSGLILIAITITYNLTGHLLMENIHQSLVALAQSQQYTVPLTVIMGLYFVGIGIKSALYPFHTWLPDAYGYSTPAASAVLSSIASKAYIFLLIKIFYRMFGMELLQSSEVLNLLFAFGLVGMIMGSVHAIFSHDMRRMVAFSSVAQIGYIFAGLGLQSDLGFAAAIYHMLMHACAKSALFISSSALADASGNSKRFSDLRSSGFRWVTAGICFSVAALSLVGIPVLGGFISKLYLSEAAISAGGLRMILMLSALGLSTLLNVLYFVKTVITLYRPPREDFKAPAFEKPRTTTWAMWGFVALNVLVGLLAQPIMNAIRTGLTLFK